MGALASVTVAQAAVIINTRTPLNLSVFVPFSEKDHFQPQSLSGTGETKTGAKYNGTGVTQDQFGGSVVNGQFQETSINRFDMIGQGPGNNFSVHDTAHITVNANGTLTVAFDNFSVACR